MGHHPDLHQGRFFLVDEAHMRSKNPAKTGHRSEQFLGDLMGSPMFSHRKYINLIDYQPN
jgi:hypothetical protein